jgi:hypothetical protein
VGRAGRGEITEEWGDSRAGDGKAERARLREARGGQEPPTRPGTQSPARPGLTGPRRAASDGSASPAASAKPPCARARPAEVRRGPAPHPRRGAEPRASAGARLLGLRGPGHVTFATLGSLKGVLALGFGETGGGVPSSPRTAGAGEGNRLPNWGAPPFPHARRPGALLHPSHLVLGAPGGVVLGSQGQLPGSP